MHRRMLARGVLLPLAITAAFFGATTAVILYGEGVPPYRVGERVQEAITARVDFSYVDAAKTDKLREDAHADVWAVYVLNEGLLARVEAELAALFEVAKAEPTSKSQTTSSSRAERSARPPPPSSPAGCEPCRILTVSQAASDTFMPV